ncbi:MAG: hypothetical protein QM734_14985 [Cyclobacteriaceae bacterium]
MKTKQLFLFLISSFGVLAFQSVYSQSSIDKIVIGSKEDANYLVNGYASPALSIIGYGLNQGWYNTAKPHKLLGFDITATVNLITVPTSALNYYVDNNKLNTVELTDGNGNPQSGNVPTVFGANVRPVYAFKADPTNTIQGAPGVDLSQSPIKNTLPVPMAQVGIGLIKGTELKVRFVPTIKFGDNSASSFSLIGFGIMHDIKQHIPAIKLLPFDLSAFIGYTSMKMNVAFDSQNHPDQQGSLTSNATTIQGLISKKLAVLTAYAGLGYNFASTTAKVSGTYDITNTGNYNTPINVNMSGSATGPRATFGLRLKLAILTIHGEYTAQKYSAITAGVGLSIR